MAFTYVLFQSLLLPYGDALRSLIPDDGTKKYDQYNIQPGHTSANLAMVRNPLTVLDLANISTPVGNTDSDDYILVKGIQHDSTPNSKGKYVKEEESPRDGFELSSNGNHDIGFESRRKIETDGNRESEGTKSQVNNSILHADGEASFEFPLEQFVKPSDTITSENELEEIGTVDMDFDELKEFKESSLQKPEDTDMTLNSSTFMLQIPISLVDTPYSEPLMSNQRSSVSENNSKSLTKRKKMKSEMPPKSITSLEEMNSILLRHRRSSRAMVWMLVLVLTLSYWFDDHILC